MILLASSRTDIVAFYLPWLIDRINQGFIDIRNPYNPKVASRVFFSDVEGIIFYTKNPLPLLKNLTKIPFKIALHVTITGYHDDFEPNLPPKKDIINAVKQISKIIGKNRVTLRYDPIIINDRYNHDYHLKSFSKLLSTLKEDINNVIISFVDITRNVRNNSKILKIDPDITKYIEIAKELGMISSKQSIPIQTCAENVTS